MDARTHLRDDITDDRARSGVDGSVGAASGKTCGECVEITHGVPVVLPLLLEDIAAVPTEHHGAWRPPSVEVGGDRSRS
jgi:hypothetical protein